MYIKRQAYFVITNQSWTLLSFSSSQELLTVAETGHYLTCLVKFCTVPPKLEKNVLFLLLSGEGA